MYINCRYIIDACRNYIWAELEFIDDIKVGMDY